MNENHDEKGRFTSAGGGVISKGDTVSMGGRSYKVEALGSKGTIHENRVIVRTVMPNGKLGGMHRALKPSDLTISGRAVQSQKEALKNRNENRRARAKGEDGHYDYVHFPDLDGKY